VFSTKADLGLLTLARTRGHAPTVERAVGRFSKLGEHGACWLALGLGGAVADPGRRGAWLRGVGAVAVTYGANYAIKVTVRRPRPVLPGLPPLTSTVSRLSFPSAHTSTSFAGATAFSKMVPAAVVYPVAIMFALSRPYLGVHYPSDVVAGAALGLAIGGLVR
jgi:membrane-associated phospholipid phosphatase